MNQWDPSVAFGIDKFGIQVQLVPIPVHIPDAACGMNADRCQIRNIVQFVLSGMKSTAVNCSEKSLQRRVAAFQFSPVFVAVLARQGILDVGEFDLRRDIRIIQIRKTWQVNPDAIGCSKFSRANSFQECFSFISQTFEVERVHAVALYHCESYREMKLQWEEPNTFFRISVVRARGFARISASR